MGNAVSSFTSNPLGSISNAFVQERDRAMNPLGTINQDWMNARGSVNDAWMNARNSITGMFGGGGGGGASFGGARTYTPINLGQNQMRTMGNQFQYRGMPPQRMNVMPLAQRPQMQMQQRPQYQNMGMFGGYNPFMPRR